MKKIKFLALTLLLFLVSTHGVDAATILPKAVSGKIILTEDVTLSSEFVVNADEDIILDLNGKKLNLDNILVQGKLTIDDQTNKGEIVSSNKEKAIEVDKGQLVINGGTIKNSNKYGVAVFNDGKVIINDGTIISKDSPLSGNNTLGKMYFEVNGGILTATEGPAIYLPGPTGLKMTGGTLNGGISARMGEINISGGTINATNGEIDSVIDYYNYSGNAWLAPALYVFGGTYTHKDGNDLSINITGGNFNNTNGEGEAITIYDLGKVEQKISVNISGGNFNAKDKSSFEILNLTDLNAIVKPGYNNSENIGKVSFEITGGTFSKLDTKYVKEGYILNKDGKVSLPIKEAEIEKFDTDKEVKEITIGVVDVKEVEDVLLKSLESSKDIDTTGINASVKIDIDSVESQDIDKDLVNEIEEKLEDKYKYATVLGYFDINLNVINKDTNTNIGKLTDLEDKITLSVLLPKELKDVKEGYKRNYYIIRNHNGVSEFLDAKLSEDGNLISFETDKFSIYVLAYEDVNDIDNPNTFDGIVLYLVLGIISLIGLILTTKYLKNQKN